jgi:hypothetical protein
MTTTAKRTAEKEINWLFPDEKQVVTEDDFQKMVRDAESQPSYSYQEHRRIVNEWQQKHP